MILRLLVYISFFGPAFMPALQAQAHPPTEEVLFSFRYGPVGLRYVNCLYHHDHQKTYLPVTELLNLFEIPFRYHAEGNIISGNFPGADDFFALRTDDLKLTLGNKSITLAADQIIKGEAEFFADPEIFSQYFGLHFNVDLPGLHLSMSTPYTLPIEERIRRQNARNKAGPFALEPSDYPLLFPRNHSILHGGFLDYSLTAGTSGKSPYFSYQFTGGIEFLGGEMRGTLHGFTNEQHTRGPNLNNLHWRFAFSPNPMISAVSVGQLYSTGLFRQPFRGISITNNPVEPRIMNDFHIVDGNTEPESDVELYINDRLYAFTRSDGQGYYRFEAPLTYGSSKVSVRTYSPSGDRQITERRIQVPYHFLPEGTIAYDIQVGKPDRFFESFEDDSYFGHINVGYGITKWLTARAGAQYTGTSLHHENIFSYTSVSARIAKQYLINAEFAPDAFYRLNASVVFPNFTGLQLRYINYQTEGFFNTRNLLEERHASLYLPTNLFSFRTGIRLGIEQHVFEQYTSTLLRTDISARIKRFNARLAYRDYLLESNEHFISGNGQLTASVGYHVPRSGNFPGVFKGLNIRTQAVYSMGINGIYQLDLQLSRSIGRSGRMFISSAYYPGSGHLQAQAGFIADFPAVRSTSSAAISSSGLAFRQHVSGSVTADIPNKKLIAVNRPMAGRAAASFVLFVDNNNNGIYDKGDELLPYRAVKLDRTARVVTGADSIVRATMLQPFMRYNVTIERNAIPNPTLVPAYTEFSFIADPNQYKSIPVPFYRSGIIEGDIFIQADQETLRGVSGIRIELRNTTGQLIKTLRTFSDGSFYAMDIPPGKYRITVEQAQLDMLGSHSHPEHIDLEIKVSPQGDYIEGLRFVLMSY